MLKFNSVSQWSIHHSVVNTDGIVQGQNAIYQSSVVQQSFCLLFLISFHIFCSVKRVIKATACYTADWFY